jgi:uncharacterized protein (TIGR02266 family)
MSQSLQARLQVPAPAELAERYYPNGRLGGLSIDGDSPGALGQRVDLHVEVARPPRHFVVKGQLAWARHSRSLGRPAAFGVDFLPDDDATRVRLLAFAREELSSDAVRADLRHLVELKVRVVHEGGELKELTADLSAGGAFVRTWDPLPVATKVRVYLRPPLSLRTMALEGHVAWLRRVGEHPGMGIAFDGEGSTRKRLEKVVAKLAR